MMPSSPLKLAEVRHEQRRVAAMMQATPLKYHSIPSSSLYHSNCYNHYKSNYLLNRPWQPFVSNNSEGAISNHFDIDAQNLYLSDINGIKRLYDKYNGSKYAHLTHSGRVSDILPIIRAGGAPLVGVDQRQFTRSVTQGISSREANGHFLPKINNTTFENVDETWKVYNSSGLTNVKIRPFGPLSPPESSTTSLKSKTIKSTNKVSTSVLPHEKRNSAWHSNMAGPLKVSAIHDELSKVEGSKEIDKHLYKRFKNMYKIGGRHGAPNGIKLPGISAKTGGSKRNSNEPSFRYTHRQSTEIANLPTTDDLKEILETETNQETRAKKLIKYTLVKGKEDCSVNLIQRDGSMLNYGNKDKIMAEASTDCKDLNVDEDKKEDEQDGRQTILDNSGLEESDEDAKSDTGSVETDDSDESSNLNSNVTSNSSKLFRVNGEGSCDSWRDAYVNALAVARSRRPMDLSFMGSQISRPFAFSYFDHVPYCKCKKCMEKTIKNRGRSKKKVSAMKSIFGDVNLYDYYRT